MSRKTDSRCQLAVVEQVFQRITTAEFIHQTWQVTDDSWRVWGVNVAWYIPHLHHRDVPISIQTLRCRNLNTERFKCYNNVNLIFTRKITFLFLSLKSLKSHVLCYVQIPDEPPFCVSFEPWAVTYVIHTVKQTE